MTQAEDTMKQIEQNAEKVSKIIDAIITSDRKAPILTMLEDDKFQELYFMAPASSREQYHYCFPGGLVAHSLNVYKNLRILNKTFNLKFAEETMFVVAMFHDVGKASDSTMKAPHYVDSEEDWQLKKGFLYQYSTEGVHMTNHLRSIFILQSFGIKLSDEEFSAIYLNDGANYLEGNKPYAFKECPLALYLRMADRIALEQEKAG